MDHKEKNISVRSQLIELSKRGHQQLKIRHYSEARQIFEEALLLAPDDYYILTGMGDVLRLQKDFSAAGEHYRRALEFDPSNPFALRGLGDALRGLKRYGEAIEYWVKYLHLKGFRDVFVLTRIADSFKTMGNYSDSEVYYHKALTLEAGDRYALMGLADLYHKQGLELQAIEYYEKALAKGVTLINILTIVGGLHYRQGDYEKARFYYEKTLAQDPHNSYALYGLGSYYRWKNDYQRAVELWEKILEQNAGTVNLITRLGDAYRNLGRYEDAERAYKSNLDKGYDMFSLVGLIKLYCVRGSVKEVCDCYDELLRNEPDDRKILAEAGQLLLEHNKPDLALQFYCHARQHHKNNPEVSGIIAECVSRMENA